MNMDQTNNPRYRAAELGALLARHYPHAPHHLVARVVFDMQDAEKYARRAAENSCNYPMTEEQKKRTQRRQDNKQDAINATLAYLHVDPHNDTRKHSEPATIQLGGDPRGPYARLHIPGQRGDGWGEGFAIF